jgi:hypothetical protein
VDYRAFLGQEQALVLPYFGGAWVDALDRRLRVAPFEPAGWYRFGVKGRVASKPQACDRPDLSALPAVRGHLLSGRLVHSGAAAESVYFLPPDEPARFAACRARRWPSGELLFDELEFESDAEEAARRALEEGHALDAVKGVPATLRAAFGYAVVEAAARRLAIPVSPAEARAKLAVVAQGGAAAAEAFVRGLAEERALVQRELAVLHREQQVRLAAQAVRDERARRAEAARRLGARAAENAEARAEAALQAAGARLLRSRALAGGALEVTFSFLGHRFVSVADAVTLQVQDAGICLGHPPADEELTLDSLPAVIREAVETDRLVITRHE